MKLTDAFSYLLVAATIMGTAEAAATSNCNDLDGLKYDLNSILKSAWVYSPWGCSSGDPCQATLDENLILWMGRRHPGAGYGPGGVYQRSQHWKTRSALDTMKLLRGEEIDINWDEGDQGVPISIENINTIHRHDLPQWSFTGDMSANLPLVRCEPVEVAGETLAPLPPVVLPPVTTADPSSYGDPHFKTWSGKQYDFHGGCDLVLLQNSEFGNGKGLNIHIRTSIRTWWSFIESAAVQIGDSILEIKGMNYWLNGGEKKEIQTGEETMGDHTIHFKRVNDHQTVNRIDLGLHDAVGIETYKHFVRVNILNKSNKQFVGSFGLLGAYPSGDMIGRDGMTGIEDANKFGQEWQVLANEPNLFHTMEGAVQPPNTCTMPDQTKKSKQRRLGEAVITEEEAELACARVTVEEERDACIFDVMATQDKDMAGSY